VADAPRRLPRIPALVAWLLWAAFGVAALTQAGRAPNIPRGQDWRMVPAVTGHEPEPVHWLWHQDGNDRHPAGRALTLASISITRDFRAPAVVAVAGLLLLSGLLLRAAHRLRGRPRWADAFIPAILLPPALWSDLPPSALLLATVPLGLGGILVAAAAAPWVAACGWRHWPPRDPGVPTDAGPALLSFIFVAVVVTGMVFSDYDFSGWSDPALDRGLLVFRTGSALASAFGPLAVERWQLVAAAMVALVGVTGVLLVAAGYRVHDVERYRALGLGCMLGAGWLAVMMSAWGFAALLLTAVYFVWELYGPPVVSVALEAGLLTAAVGVLPATWRMAASGAARDRYVALERDVTAGVLPAELAVRYQPLLMPEGSARDLEAAMVMVAEAGLGTLAAMRGVPAAR